MTELCERALKLLQSEGIDSRLISDDYNAALFGNTEVTLDLHGGVVMKVSSDRGDVMVEFGLGKVGRVRFFLLEYIEMAIGRRSRFAELAPADVGQDPLRRACASLALVRAAIRDQGIAQFVSVLAGLENAQQARDIAKYSGGWTLTKDGRTATCTVRPHPLGVELVVAVEGEIVRTEVARRPGAERVLSDDWRRAFEDKGWAVQA